MDSANATPALAEQRMPCVAGAGRQPGAPDNQGLCVEKHVEYIKSLDTVGDFPYRGSEALSSLH